MEASGGDATVLVVDDEESVADAYALRLRLETEYDVRVAYGGRAALDAIDEAVDVVLLDRRMPDLSGDGVLNELRVAGYDCAVVMLTAVDPSYDVVELGFADYLCKPVDKEDLLRVVETQVRAATQDELLQEYLTLSNKIDLLESEYPPEKLEAYDEYHDLLERAEQLRGRLEGAEALAGIDESVSEISRGSGA